MEQASDGDEETYAYGAYGGPNLPNTSHFFGFTDVGTRSGQLRVVISNYDPDGDTGVTSVLYRVNGLEYVQFGSTEDDTPEAFTFDFVDVDLGTLRVQVKGSTSDPFPAPPGEARLHEVGFIYTEPDGDGITTGDNCPCDYNPDQMDYDGDGIGHVCDNCPFFFSLDQTDANENGIGDVCECTTQAECNDYVPCTLDVCLFELGQPIGMCKITSEGCN